MKFFPAIAAASLLSVQPIGQARADELATLVDILAMRVASVRVLSESCGIAVDPMLEGRVVEMLIRVPSFYMSDVVAHFAKAYQIQKHSYGDRCYPETPSQIESAKVIYDSTINDLRQYVENKNGQ